jgi:hypothetical protein
MTSNRKDLFRNTTTDDKLTLLHLLLDSNELNVSLTLALLKNIHGDLKRDHVSDRSVYRRYAGAIESLRHRMLDTFQLAVAAWKNAPPPAVSAPPAEWFPENQDPQEK